jgi:hypothetical protein
MRCIAVVDLPVPPFSLPTTMTCGRRGEAGSETAENGETLLTTSGTRTGYGLPR